MTKLIFLGCLSKEKYPEICDNSVKIIQYLDPQYKVLDDVPCCGSVTHHVSKDDDLQNHVNFVNDWFKTNDVAEIVTICAGCYNYLTSEYKKFIPEFKIKVKHIVQFINEPQNLEKLNLKYSGKKLVIAYHDPCHFKNADPRVIEEPRKLLSSIEGNIILKDMENNGILSLCCGSGGGVYSSFKENAGYNCRQIFEQARKARAKLLITPCPFCYTALKKVKEEDTKIKVNLMKFEVFIDNLMKGVEQII